MLDFTKTRVRQSVERPVADGFQVTAEGQGLVYDVLAGGVKPGTGVATEKFDGICMAEVLVADTLPVVEEVSIAQLTDSTVDPAVAVATFKLQGTPIAGTFVVYDATGAKITAAAQANGVVDVTTLGADLAALTPLAPFKVVYRKQATVNEIRALQGDLPIGGAATLSIGTVGVILAGDVYTTCYNTADDWANATAIKVGAGGVLTTGTGATIPNAKVIAVPGVDSMFLGIYYYFNIITWSN